MAVAPARNVRDIEQVVQRDITGLFDVIGRRLHRELEVGLDGNLVPFEGCGPERRKKRERWRIAKRPMVLVLKKRIFIVSVTCGRVPTYLLPGKQVAPIRMSIRNSVCVPNRLWRCFNAGNVTQVHLMLAGVPFMLLCMSKKRSQGKNS